MTFSILVATNKDATRSDIQLISEKVIEGLPKHNMALIAFVADASEKDKDWTIARTSWAPHPANLNDPFPPAGDYSLNIMKIAMKGQTLPGDPVQSY